VVVRRAGDVIPEVRGPVLPLRPKDLPVWSFLPPARYAVPRCNAWKERLTLLHKCGMSRPASAAGIAFRFKGGDGHRGPRRADRVAVCKEGLLASGRYLLTRFERVQGFEGFGALSVATSGGYQRVQVAPLANLLSGFRSGT